ncbi:D-alanyl-D-alanine carboxypeptidase family protein [Aerobium aerolatum]|uniref:D-alanyl-D-alanine carboxypeptidase family protein n=1 Tax=Aerobium aerolatum TaxID=561088 RepID=UPI0015881B9F|nr:D-alanyl-D-alanine carboxypeptidase family protein [Aquamicrobium aerolatum]
MLAFSRIASHVARGLTLVLVAAFLSACSTQSALESVAPLSSDKYAAIVVDANTGKVLFDRNSRELRYPASLTKMMTLYMLFEALETGRVDPTAQLPVTAFAASKPPSRLGLRPGQHIDVQTAILALCVRSANDVATVVAEYLGDSEARFAEMMTAKARQLGMNSTTFRNASGLPDADQRTSARDMAVLSTALRKRFPQHYHYFSNREFSYAGKIIRGHNDLLGRVDGVDGLKTGYIRASGFNLATSAGRGGRRIVAVVMGGETARARNAHMEELIEMYLPKASLAAAN